MHFHASKVPFGFGESRQSAVWAIGQLMGRRDNQVDGGESWTEVSKSNIPVKRKCNEFGGVFGSKC
jgi:hypothetical protein